MLGIDLSSLDLGHFGLSWREGLIALIALAALYILIELWRMRRLRQQREAALQAPPEVPAEPFTEPRLDQPAASATEIDPPASEAEAPVAAAIENAWEQASAQMAQEAFMRGVEDELAQLRDEVDALRTEVAALRDDIRQEVQQMRTTQTVSPIYADAMQMASHGHTAAIIAERCGIARAEAELVVALVKSQEQ